MKKLYILLSFIFIFLFVGSSNVFAETLKYENVITDTSSIEEDFEVLGMDVANYYKMKSPANKTYVVGYGEAILDDNMIQSYIYVYVSFANVVSSTVKFNKLTYSINGSESIYTDSQALSNIGGYLYKVKVFQYSYKKDASIKIEINKINATIHENNNAFVSTFDANGNVFEVSMSHSLLADNKPFEMELSFNSVIIIEEIQLVKVNVQPELWETCSFSSWWNTFFDVANKELYLHFYNFNFPENVEVDSIDYAKFEYDYVYYHLTHEEYRDITNSLEWEIEEEIDEVSREYKLKEYLPGTNSFETYNQSGELEFETFTLGNRITKGEFPDYVGFSDAEKAMFDYDASILLDSSVKKTHYYSSIEYYSYYYQLENVNFLELHYTNDGIQYKCQVIAEDVGDADDPEQDVDGDDPSEDKPEWWEELWEKFWDWFMENLPTSAIICVAVVILAPVLVSLLISLITGSVSTVLAGLASILKKILKLLFKFIVWLIKLPFTILKFMFGLFKK